MRIDHVAIGVASVDDAIGVLCGRLGLREGRRGTHNATGRPIVFLHDDATGVKIELTETGSGDCGLHHIAFGATDPDEVDRVHDDLVAAGFASRRAPFRLDVASARTTLVGPPALDWLVQVIAYDPGAPEAT